MKPSERRRLFVYGYSLGPIARRFTRNSLSSSSRSSSVLLRSIKLLDHPAVSLGSLVVRGHGRTQNQD